MRLNHLNLAVSDLPAAKTFLQTYFGLTPIPGAPENERFCILRDDDGIALTLMSTGTGAKVSYPASFHVGFIQPNPGAVDAINQRLRDDGFDVKAPRHFHGSWTFYTRAPGGIQIEVLA